MSRATPFFVYVRFKFFFVVVHAVADMQTKTTRGVRTAFFGLSVREPSGIVQE